MDYFQYQVILMLYYHLIHALKSLSIDHLIHNYLNLDIIMFNFFPLMNLIEY